MRAEAMVVVVPVRDEEALLGAALDALRIAVKTAEASGVRCVVRIVLDACTDASADIAAASGFVTLQSTAGRVGAARALGVADALHELRDEPLATVWIANTDADSRVPANWLSHQREVSRRADVCLGTVRPDFADLTPAQRELWPRTHPKGEPAGNVHGANLGLRASTYVESGGFAAIGEHEDVDLVARCRHVGAVVVASDDAEVETSGRTLGRTPGGYAGFLHDQAATLSNPR